MVVFITTVPNESCWTPMWTWSCGRHRPASQHCFYWHRLQKTAMTTITGQVCLHSCLWLLTLSLICQLLSHLPGQPLLQQTHSNIAMIDIYSNHSSPNRGLLPHTHTRARTHAHMRTHTKADSSLKNVTLLQHLSPPRHMWCVSEAAARPQPSLISLSLHITIHTTQSLPFTADCWEKNSLPSPACVYCHMHSALFIYRKGCRGLVSGT